MLPFLGVRDCRFIAYCDCACFGCVMDLLVGWLVARTWCCVGCVLAGCLLFDVWFACGC